ncbi:MAG: methyltransferase domain-containing protein [Pseudomonadota bacterium]
MEANLQRRIQRYGWDKAADAYEAGWKQSLAAAQSELLLRADASPGEHVLDIACGTGLVTLPLAHAVGREGRVIATDLSARMVDLLRIEAEVRGLAQVEAFRADTETLSGVADGSVDLVTCALGLMYVPEPRRALAEALRVLKPGGRAVFAVWGERRHCGWSEIFPIVDARVKSEVCPLFFRLGTGAALSVEMEEAGFYGIGGTRLRTSLHYRDDRAALEAAFVGGPVALAYARFDAAVREAVHAEYLQSIAPFRTEGRYQIPGEFVVNWGFKPV